MTYLLKSVLPLLIAFFFLPTTGTAGPVDLYGQLLSQYVKDGRVDYQGFRQHELQLDKYLAYLAETDPTPMTRFEQMAFYINAYNAYTIKLILQNFEDGKPPESIKDIGIFFSKPWSIKFVKIGGKILTLDNVEHDILRPVYKDNRVHFAVNCASVSCPPLISEPYRAATLDEQLTSNTVRFIHNNKENRLKGNTLMVSAIFKWFKKDFNKDPLAFFIKYSQGDLNASLLKERNTIEVGYLNYDWSLNGQL